MEWCFRGTCWALIFAALGLAPTLPPSPGSSKSLHVGMLVHDNKDRRLTDRWT